MNDSKLGMPFSLYEPTEEEKARFFAESVVLICVERRTPRREIRSKIQSRFGIEPEEADEIIDEAEEKHQRNCILGLHPP